MNKLRSWVKITVSLALGALFLWLAFRNVKFDELLANFDDISYAWILPFAAAILVAHYFRAERWKLLIREQVTDPHRMTLFSGVMLGYLLNFVFPRLGEVTRPVYVARREQLSTSNLLGTIILERVIDMVTLVLMLAFVFVYIIADVQVLQNIFGEAAVSFFQNFFEWRQLLMMGGGLLLTALVAYIAYQGVEALAERYQAVNNMWMKVRKMGRTFLNGLFAIKDIERWGSFIAHTVIIWIGYIMMTYIPFWMFDMQQIFGLGLVEALSVTVISAIGIVIPTPGGIGTYHYFVKQSLLILFAVPAATGLAYATVTHAVMMLIIIVATPLVILIERMVVNGSETGSFSLSDIKAAEEQP